MKNIIFIAAPAAGKGTMSEALMDKYGYAHISTGDILRSMAKEDSELGRTLSDLLSKGELISDEIVYQAVQERLSMPDLDNGYILDGFPRNIEQAIKYDDILKNIGRDLGIVIELKTPVEILKKRITGRRICKECGQTHNVLTGVNAPKVENKCNKCGGELYQRGDDNEESFKTRYQTYLDKTLPIIEYYNKKGVLHSLESCDPEETLKEIEALINDYN